MSGFSEMGTSNLHLRFESTPMTTAAICASRELSWRPSFYRGEQFDADLGLYYLRARYYNPQTGRFLSRDPEAGKPVAPSTLHKYLYAGGDPINKIDPRGREELLEYAFMAYHLTIEGIDFGHDEKGCLVDAFVGLATGIGSATDGSTTANEGLNIAMALGGCSDEADYNLALGFIWSKVFPFSGAD